MDSCSKRCQKTSHKECLGEKKLDCSMAKEKVGSLFAIKKGIDNVSIRLINSLTHYRILWGMFT